MAAELIDISSNETTIFAKVNMIKRMNYGSVPFRISLGFAGSALLLFAVLHPGICYLSLLALSAFHKHLPIKQVQRWVQTWQPVYASVVIGLFSTIAVLVPSPAMAQWNEAQDAAKAALDEYLGEGIVELLFTVVFILIFFLIMGGLMAWGYKAFRNEDAAVPMTAFIVGTVIFVGGEVFSALLFTEG